MNLSLITILHQLSSRLRLFGHGQGLGYGAHSIKTEMLMGKWGESQILSFRGFGMTGKFCERATGKALLDHDFMRGNRQGCATGELILDCFDDVVRSERFPVIFPDVTMGCKPGFRTQISRKLA
jgi:hypothetical protein